MLTKIKVYACYIQSTFSKTNLQNVSNRGARARCAGPGSSFDLEALFGGSGGGATGVATPPPSFQISKIKESNKTKQKIEDNPLEKEEESRKEWHMFV